MSTFLATRSELNYILLNEYRFYLFERQESLASATLKKILTKGFTALSEEDKKGIEALKALAEAGKGIDLKKILDSTFSVSGFVKKVVGAIKDAWSKITKQGFSLKTIGDIIDFKSLVNFSFDQVIALISFGSGPTGLILRPIVKALGVKIGTVVQKLIRRAQGALAYSKTGFAKVMNATEKSRAAMSKAFDGGLSDKEIEARIAKYKKDAREHGLELDIKFKGQTDTSGKADIPKFKNVKLTSEQIRRLVYKEIYL